MIARFCGIKVLWTNHTRATYTTRKRTLYSFHRAEVWPSSDMEVIVGKCIGSIRNVLECGVKHPLGTYCVVGLRYQGCILNEPTKNKTNQFGLKWVSFSVPYQTINIYLNTQKHAPVLLKLVRGSSAPYRAPMEIDWEHRASGCPILVVAVCVVRNGSARGDCKVLLKCVTSVPTAVASTRGHQVCIQYT